MRPYRAANGVRLKGLSQSGHWPSGNPRFYLRLPGKKAIPMPDLPKSHPDFLAFWLAATGKPKPLDRKPTVGTVGALVVGYMASAAYQNLAPSTRAYMRRNLEAIRKTWGNGKAADLEPRHILLDLSKLKPHPANNRLRAWRAMCRWGFQEAAMLPLDPAAPVKKRRTPKSDGHPPWTREDVAAFRAFWPHDKPQRLAFELIYRTGAAVVDACALGPDMVQGGFLRYVRQKSGSPAICPMMAETSPPWFEHDDHLALCLAAQRIGKTYLLTAEGQPRSEHATSGWFSKAARQAGVMGKTAHGLRKLRSEIFQENGASVDKRMAILGHETAAEARHYSSGADLIRTVMGSEISNLPAQLPTSSDKALENKAVAE